MAQTWEFKAYATLADYENRHPWFTASGYGGFRAAKTEAVIIMDGRSGIVKFQTIDCELINVLYYDGCQWFGDYEKRAQIKDTMNAYMANGVIRHVLVVGHIEFNNITAKIKAARLVVPGLTLEKATEIGEYIRNSNNDDFVYLTVVGNVISLTDSHYTKLVIPAKISKQIMEAV